MSDPIGSAGLRNGNSESQDLAAVMRGGATFMDRLQRLADAKDAHDAALANLQLGQEAAAAFKHASQLHTEARDANSRASSALVEANQKSTAILNEAKATAKRIVDQARREADGLVAEAKQKLAQASLDANRIAGEVEELKATAKTDRDEAAAQRDRLNEEESRLDRARSEHGLAADALNMKISRINDVHRRLGALLQEAGRAHES